MSNIVKMNSAGSGTYSSSQDSDTAGMILTGSKVFTERLWNVQILKKVENDIILIKIILENDDDKVETNYLKMFIIGSIKIIINNIINKREITTYALSNSGDFWHSNKNEISEFTEIYCRNNKYYFRYFRICPSNVTVQRILKDVEITLEDALDLLYQFQEIHDNS